MPFGENVPLLGGLPCKHFSHVYDEYARGKLRFVINIVDV